MKRDSETHNIEHQARKIFEYLIAACCSTLILSCIFMSHSCYAMKSITFWPDNLDCSRPKVLSLMVDGHGMKIDQVLPTDKRFPLPMGGPRPLESWDEFVSWRERIDFTPARSKDLVVSQWSHDPDCHRRHRSLTDIALPQVRVDWLVDDDGEQNWQAFTLPPSQPNTDFVVAIHGSNPSVYILGSASTTQSEQDQRAPRLSKLR